LDKDHRRALFEQYFPHAAHQVIILSTDSEFDEQAFEMLRPSISHAYHLLYQQEARATEIEEGYFWRVEEHVPVEVAAHSLLG
jgi:DNA sulfur modification protein DndD